MLLPQAYASPQSKCWKNRRRTASYATYRRKNWIRKKYMTPPSRETKLAKSIFDFTGEILGLSLANFVMFSSPEAIILFGGLTKAGDLILKPTRDSMESNLIQVFQNKVKILISHLKESDAAILGASALVWDMKP